MIVVPYLLGGAVVWAVQAGEGLPAQRAAELDGATPSSPPSSATVGWIWPLAPWNGIKPEVSDGVGSARDGGARKHHGCDIDFRRARGAYPQFKPGTRQASPGGLYICPDGVKVRAARAGRLWSCGASPKGLQLVIDHGAAWGATYYQHLRTLRFAARVGGSDGAVIEAGQELGEVGNGYQPGGEAPDAFNHLHFEWWWHGGAESWRDPMPLLKSARHLP